MARRRPIVRTRAEWHTNPSGCWSLSLGERGCRVRVVQKVKGGTFARETWIPGRGRSLASLQTTSRVEARTRAEAFLRALLGGETQPERPLTLDALWTQYQEESPQYRRNTVRTQREKVTTMELVLLGLGPRSLVSRLTLSNVERYLELRRRGTGWPDGRVTESVGPRTVAHDLQVLRAVIRWGCTVRKPDGNWLMQENPLRGLTLPREATRAGR